ncbi:hypothetical protein CU098_002486, partial [Rhizopus stolonifer]
VSQVWKAHWRFVMDNVTFDAYSILQQTRTALQLLADEKQFMMLSKCLACEAVLVFYTPLGITRDDLLSFCPLLIRSVGKRGSILIMLVLVVRQQDVFCEKRIER